MTIHAIQRSIWRFELLAQLHGQWAEELVAIPPAFGGAALDSMEARRRRRASEAHEAVWEACEEVVSTLRDLLRWVDVG